jgi:rhodanese-related sulfurtransferase/glyoxylase-like metal-dependent hydrolase (beta-lactamase superfamily II)
LILKQYPQPWLSHLSYLIVEEVSRTGIVIDPCGNPDLYLAEAWRLRTPINHIFLTKAHTDFQKGPRELRDRTAASLYLGAGAEAAFGATPVKDGDVLEFGFLRLQVLETPGHKPEAICLLLFNLKENDRRPAAVLTGDTLLVGDVGRPPAVSMSGASGKWLTQCLYHTVQGKLSSLPDDTVVYPGHTAAASSGTPPREGERSTTIGAQRRANFAFWPADREEFARRLGLESPGARAPHRSVWAVDGGKSRRDPGRGRKPGALGLEEFLEFGRDKRVQILDVRCPADFAGGHLDGAINLALGLRFESWAGRILDRERPVLLIAEPGQEEEAAESLRGARFTRVAGYLQGGMEALETRPDRVRSTPRVAAIHLGADTSGAATRVLLDVRSRSERRGPVPEGTRLVPLEELEDRMGEVPQDRPVVVASVSGYRSSAAASLLERAGYQNVQDLVGGWAALERVV